MMVGRTVAGSVAFGLCAALTSLLGLGACNDTGPARAPSAPVVESLDHEECNPAGHKTESFDARGNGKAVITKVYDGTGHELCRITDINHDGKPDLYEYFDGSGTVRRREADYDGSGVIDSVEFYEGGKLVKREYDTTGQHRVDTWDYFDKTTGKRVRRERDTTNDGKVDQWWTWNGDKITIAIDRDGDGKPDPDMTLVLDDKTGETTDVSSATGGSGASAARADGPPPPVAPPISSAATAPPPPSLIDTATVSSHQKGAGK
jgi:hypothetical protein